MTSKSRKQIATTIGVFCLAIFIAIFGWNLYGVKYMANAREAELRTNMSSVMTSMNAYFEEYGKYSSDLKSIGYSSEGDLRSIIYLKAEDVPVDLRIELSDSELPYVHDNDYQILGVYKDISGISFWIQKKGESLRMIKAREGGQ